MKTQALVAIKMLFALTILTGMVYPLFITAFAQLFFREKANGSLITENKVKIGSKLIGQLFDSPGYFSSRPSAVSYSPLPSGGSNMGLTNAALKELVNKRRAGFYMANLTDSCVAVPSEMVFASGSGLDPHISPEAAYLQVGRISGCRNFNPGQKDKLLRAIQDLTEKPQFGLLGKNRINVLLLNLEVDKIK